MNLCVAKLFGIQVLFEISLLSDLIKSRLKLTFFISRTMFWRENPLPFFSSFKIINIYLSICCFILFNILKIPNILLFFHKHSFKEFTKKLFKGNICSIV